MGTNKMTDSQAGDPENGPVDSDAKLCMLKTELLKRIDLFSPLPPSSLEYIVENSRDIALNDGETLFPEGISEKMMYTILSGQILICKGNKRIAVLTQGEYLGEMPLIDFKSRSASAKAVGNVLLMEISVEIFNKFITSNSKALFEMMKVFSSRIRGDLDSMSNDMLKMSNFTHDMRNCLVPLGIVEVLLSEAMNALKGTQGKHKKREGWEQVKKGFDTMVSVKNNLIVMIDQCLACVKKTKSEYVKAELEILPLIEETVEEISCHKNLKNKLVRVKVEGKVKKGLFNYLDIKRVLQNLIINAGYVTENNGEIDILVKDLNDMIQVSVKDYGCGIPNNVKPLLLKETYTTKPDGNGFGLMSAREIIEEYHAGKIWFETELGKGTAFHFTIPHSN